MNVNPENDSGEFNIDWDNIPEDLRREVLSELKICEIEARYLRERIDRQVSSMERR